MRVQIITKREAGITGTIRYTTNLYEGFKSAGVNTRLTFPVQTVFPAILQEHLREREMDLEAFFASYPFHASLETADIYHLTSQMLATLLLFQRFPQPVAVTVHDIIPYLVQDQPELNTFRHPIDSIFYRLALLGLRRADMLIAVSNYTRQTLLQELNMPTDRIRVVYPGIDLERFRTLVIPPAFWSKYGLRDDERYILFVGSEDPRKNLSTLIRVLALVKQQIPEVKLLKVGSAHYDQERQKLLELITSLNLKQDILFFNCVSEEDLPYFYNAAEVLVMPSFYEGFGLPVVEAMACGTPVICSWAGSLPEVAGEAGLYVDPTDPQKIANTLLRLLDSPKERLWMKQIGPQQAAQFSLTRTAHATREVYTEILKMTSNKNQLKRYSIGPSKDRDQAFQNNKMKVVIVVPSFPSIECGVSTYSNYLTKELGKLVDVEVVGRSSPSSPRSILKEVEDAAKYADIIHVQHAFDLYGYMGHLTFPLYRFLQKSGKTIVTTLHEFPELKSRALKTRVASAYLKSCIKAIVQNSDAVLVHTQATLNLLREWQLKKQIHLIPHGTINWKIDTNTSHDPPETPTIGFFGFITENKGIQRLLDAMVHLPNAQLIVAGEARTNSDEAYLTNLKSKAMNLGVAERVKFLGFLPDRAMVDFFRSADLVVFPYSSCTASGALHLALAHGSVVLTSNLSVFLELKAKYDCLEVFELEKQDHLVNQIQRLLIDSRRRTELIAGCQRMMNDTSWMEVAKQTYGVYQNLLKEVTP